MIDRALTGLLAVLLTLALAGMGYQAKQAGEARDKLTYARDKLAEVEREFSTYRELVERNALLQAKADLKKRLLEEAAQQEAIDDALKKRDAAVADARHARNASDLLRKRADALAAAGACRDQRPAEAFGSGQPASSALDLFAVVLGRLDQAAGELAEYADAAHIAGQLCERSYRALSPPP